MNHGDHLDSGPETRPASMLKATSVPIVISAVEYVERAEAMIADVISFSRKPVTDCAPRRDLLDPKAHRDRLRAAIVPDPALQRLHRQAT